MSHAQNHDRRYRYYVSRPSDADTGKSQWRLSSVTIEPVVEQQFYELLDNQPRLARWLSDLLPSRPVAGLLAAATALGERYRQLDEHLEKQHILRKVFDKITVRPEAIAFEVSPRSLLEMLAGEPPKEMAPVTPNDIVTITLPIHLRRRGVESRIVL